VLDRLPAPILREPEPWMADMAGANLKGLFLRAPLALRYIAKHPDTLPNSIAAELAEAGLVEQHDGRAQVRRYSHGGTRPYSSEGINPETRAALQARA